MKKNICLVMPGRLPIPAIKGGAIETLVTHLIDENEKYQEVNFEVICPYATGIELFSRKYNHTKFHYIKSNLFLCKCINFTNFIIIKIFNKIDFFPTQFHLKAKKYLVKKKYDYIVVEHAIYQHFEYLTKYYNPNQLFLHLHGVVDNPDIKTQKLYGNIIGVSNYVINQYKLNCSNVDVNYHICLNSINEENFNKRITLNERNTLRSKFGVDETDFLVIYCGRLVEIKGVLELCNAIKKINNPKIKLMIVGSTNFKNSKKTKYIELLDKIIDGNRIFSTGFVDNDELYKFYQSADLQVVPSICEEGASLVSVEGMMSHLPLLITNSGGILEYVNENKAIVINKSKFYINNRVDLVEDLCEAIINIYNDCNLRNYLIESSKEESKRFKKENLYRDFINVFNK